MAKSNIVSMDTVVRRVASAHRLSLLDARAVLDTLLEVIVDGVSKNKSVNLTKFGKFYPFVSQAYVARNPQNGKPVRVPCKRRVKFHAFDAFVAKVESCSAKYMMSPKPKGCSKPQKPRYPTKC